MNEPEEQTIGVRTEYASREALNVSLYGGVREPHEAVMHSATVEPIYTLFPRDAVKNATVAAREACAAEIMEAMT